jgi:hypothetical protein
MEKDQLRCRIGRDIFLFDKWEFVSLWGFRQEDEYKTWVRFCLTKNDKPVVGKQNVLFEHLKDRKFDPDKLFNKPRLMIERTCNSKQDLFFKLASFDFDLDASIKFHHLEEMILPFPQIYTAAGDYEKAKRHCDRFVRTITNLPAFF